MEARGEGGTHGRSLLTTSPHNQSSACAPPLLTRSPPLPVQLCHVVLQPYDSVHGCFNPARDIVAAPYSSLGIREAADVYAKLRASQGRDPDRTHLFFFAGGVRPDRHVYSGEREAAASAV